VAVTLQDHGRWDNGTMRRLRNSTFPRNHKPDSGQLAFAQFTTSLLTDSGQALKERERIRRTTDATDPPGLAVRENEEKSISS